ncbi:UbiA family prenyltransferase [Candidatus Neomarinimicrobiota bacterium]
MTSKTPICVDLDGSLIKTDLLNEAALALLKLNPLYIFSIFVWLLQGRANLKHQIASRVSINAASLPYNQELCDYLKEESDTGCEIVLVTASNKRYAESIGNHLGFISNVIASDANQNLKGKEKARVLTETYGEGNFIYVGDSYADLQVWKQSKAAVVVNVSGRRRKQLKKMDIEEIKHFASDNNYFHSIFQAARPYQWVKNILIFVPLVMSHQIGSGSLVLQSILGFFAMSFVASSVYVLNDLGDLEADRLHPDKKTRPFAAGDLPISTGIILIIILLSAGLSVAAMLPSLFLYILEIYFITNIFYTMLFKRIVILDIIILSLLYTIRILAGGAAINEEIGFWLLAFSMFIFLSLSMQKRYAELKGIQERGLENAEGRAYQATDENLILAFGAMSGLISVLVLALYINSTVVIELYNQPQILWLTCPIMLYWISRMWLLTNRGIVSDDPIRFAVGDRTSYIVGGLMLSVILIATIGI